MRGGEMQGPEEQGLDAFTLAENLSILFNQYFI